MKDPKYPRTRELVQLAWLARWAHAQVPSPAAEYLAVLGRVGYLANVSIRMEGEKKPGARCHSGTTTI